MGSEDVGDAYDVNNVDEMGKGIGRMYILPQTYIQQVHERDHRCYRQ